MKDPFLPSKIMASVAARHGLEVSDLVGRLQGKDVVRARHEAIRELRATGMGFSAIGRRVNRDHSTVHAVIMGKAR